MDWHPLDTQTRGEASEALARCGTRNGFCIRQPGLDTAVERALALQRLQPSHQRFQAELGLHAHHLRLAEQVHGPYVAVLTESSPVLSPGVDALVTACPKLCLGIYVADCCAVYVVDPKQRVVGLAHSGAKGTQLGVVPEMLRTMQSHYGSRPEDLTSVLSPCIRPPSYEIDFAAQIRQQLAHFGVPTVLDSRLCTGAHPQRYYSYRLEKGATGRMLALLALNPSP